MILTLAGLSAFAGINVSTNTDSVYTSVMDLHIIHKSTNSSDSIAYSVQNMPEGRTAILSIVEVSGKSIYSAPIESNSGQAKGILVPTYMLAPGNYIVSVVSGRHTAIKQLIIDSYMQ